MKKRILKFIKEAFDNRYVKFFSYLVLAVVVFALHLIFQGEDVSFLAVIRKIFDMIRSEDTLTVLLAALLSLLFARTIRVCDKYLEESYKINDDHHAIITEYDGHKKEYEKNDENIIDKTGHYMTLSCADNSKSKRLKPSVKDTFSSQYKSIKKAIDSFKDGILCLPTINVFANVKGNTNIVFKDSTEIFPLPNFVVDNATVLLSAHKNSTKSNKSTVRLTDFEYDPKKNELTLETQRTTYFHMLMTNRCMDFEVYDGVTIRSAYEYEKTITKLANSKLSNQIGINGLVLTSDGYLLIEKRANNKTTWKNKFGQPISLALKTRSLDVGDGIIPNTYEEADKKISKIIYRTLKDNFGLENKDFEEFKLKENFLGIARDLLEGGKPNLYFYITTKHTAKELAYRLEKKAGSRGSDALQTSKLSSDYYIVPFEDIKIGYDYTLKLNRNNCYWPHRKVYPRVKLCRAVAAKARHKILRCLKPWFSHECGEALLVTISYLELCKNRISVLNKQERRGGHNGK